MKKNINLIIAMLLGVVGLTFTSCSDDDTPVAKAVLCSVFSLDYEAVAPEAQTVKVVSDALWHVECPDWIEVSPATGSGTTIVTVTVKPNVDAAGAMCSPRKADLIFKGNTKASEAVVVVSQKGDKYLGLSPESIAKFYDKADEAYVIVKDLTVVAPISAGFVATDGTDIVQVTTTQPVEAGEVYTVSGQKNTDKYGMAVLEGDIFTAAGTPAAAPAATDITADFDTYKSARMTHVKVAGMLSGKNLTVEGATNAGVVTDVATGFDIAAYTSHNVVLDAYYVGTVAPAVNMIVVGLEDKGIAEVIYWSDDFEWLAPWAEVGNGTPCGDTVGSDDPGANAPQLGTPKVDGVSAYDALVNKGYELLVKNHESKSERKPQAANYLQSNYIKFGLTGYQGGIILPPMTEIPEGAACLLRFDWSGMRQGSGAIDPLDLVVTVINGDKQEEFAVAPLGWESGHKLEWVGAEVDLSGVTIDKNTRIQIKPSQWGVSSANRWFLDNVRVVAK